MNSSYYYCHNNIITSFEYLTFQSESTTSMNSSKGIEPREFNQQSSLFRLQMVERMKERSSQ